MIHKKFPINPVFPNGTDSEGLSSMRQAEMKSKGGTAAIVWLSFPGFSSDSCAISIRYGCAVFPHDLAYGCELSRSSPV